LILIISFSPIKNLRKFSSTYLSFFLVRSFCSFGDFDDMCSEISIFEKVFIKTWQNSPYILEEKKIAKPRVCFL